MITKFFWENISKLNFLLSLIPGLKNFNRISGSADILRVREENHPSAGYPNGIFFLYISSYTNICWTFIVDARWWVLVVTEPRQAKGTDDGNLCPNFKQGFVRGRCRECWGWAWWSSCWASLARGRHNDVNLYRWEIALHNKSRSFRLYHLLKQSFPSLTPSLSVRTPCPHARLITLYITNLLLT